jgi:hypothetical protein
MSYSRNVTVWLILLSSLVTLLGCLLAAPFLIVGGGVGWLAATSLLGGAPRPTILCLFGWVTLVLLVLLIWSVPYAVSYQLVGIGVIPLLIVAAAFLYRSRSVSRK